VPKGTPRAVVDRLQAETARIVHSPEVKQLLNNGGTEPVGGTPEQFAASVKSELARYTKVAKEAGIKAD
jgi:tripartite-type tricarboxylate transporter receptor subunit TctC